MARIRRMQLFMCFAVFVFILKSFLGGEYRPNQPYANEEEEETLLLFATTKSAETLSHSNSNSTKPAISTTPKHPSQLPPEDANNSKGSVENNSNPVSSSSQSPPLIIYLHFHKAGGTTMLMYMREKIGLKDIQHAKEYLDTHKGNDFKLRGNTPNSLCIYSSSSSATTTTSSSSSRVGNPSFWKSIQSEGVNFVSLEYNFVTPTQFDNLTTTSAKTTTTTTTTTTAKLPSKSDSTIIIDATENFINNNHNNNNVSSNNIKFVTVMRDPWGRFRSTYERELYITFKKQQEQQQKSKQQRNRDSTTTLFNKTLEMNCYNDNKMDDWMKSLDKQFPRKNFWGGILRENYYVRMLNGINDRKVPVVRLYDYHLQYAKDVIRQFDLVLLLDDPSLKSKFDIFLNNNNFVVPGKIRNEEEFPHYSNNKLKNWETYDIIRQDLEKHRKAFAIRNSLDIQLYDFVQKEIAKDW